MLPGPHRQFARSNPFGTVFGFLHRRQRIPPLVLRRPDDSPAQLVSSKALGLRAERIQPQGPRTAPEESSLVTRRLEGCLIRLQGETYPSM